MRILMLTDYFLPHKGGGVERVVLEIGRRLVNMGHEVDVLTLNTVGAPAHEIIEGITVHRAPVVQLTEMAGAQCALSFQVLPIAIKLARQRRFDMIHAHNLFFWTTAMAVILRRILKKPLVVTLHLGSLANLNGVYKPLAHVYQETIGRLILHESGRIIAVSEAVYEHAEKLGSSRRKLRLITNGVDLEIYKPNCHALFSREYVNVAFIGRLIFNKGPQFVVEAAPAILKEFPRVKFKFVGDGPMRQTLENRVKELNLTSACEFLGLQDNVHLLLQDADMLIRPSLLEGMPLAVLEAMACGLPVVATRVGGTPELVRDQFNGLLIEPSQAMALASAILQLLREPDVGRRMGQIGRDIIEKSHSWDQIAAQTVSVYEELV